MKVGDRVRFLYAKGGGVVKGFQGKDLVIIEDEDGFDIPTLIKECVVIEQDETNNVNQISQSVNNPIRNYVKQEQEKTPQTPQNNESYEYEEVEGGDEISIHLAFLSNDIKKLGSSTYDLFLINESNYFVNYTLLYKSVNGWNLKQAGEIEPNTKIFVEEVESKLVNDFEHICIQCISYKKDKPFTLKSAISKELKLDLSKLFKVHCFRTNKFFEEGAVTYSVVVNDATQEFDDTLLEKSLAVLSSTVKNLKKDTKVNKNLNINKVTGNIIEIDLHIEQLLDNSKGLSNFEMLSVQMKEFEKIMQENLKNKGQKIVFIHGKGEGVLKKEILKQLQKSYAKFPFQDASFREYGYGATMVTIK